MEGMEINNVHDSIDYSEYWEKCWKEENAEELSGYLEGWNGHSGEEIDIFRQYGVKRICDAACGFGAHTLVFASNGFEVSAFDVSVKAVELTTYGLRKFGYEGIDVKVASIMDTGYDDESFDAVAAYAVMDHLTFEDARRALAELMRIIRKDGLLLMTFDAPEEEDFQCEHEELPDGSMVYTDALREGMLFRPYDDGRISALVDGYCIVRQWNDRKGGPVVLLQKTTKLEK
jgi:SAM-dependent methyltransferase